MTPEPGRASTILHLSDLHFGSDADDTGESEKASVRGLLKRRRLEMQAHDPYILACLPTEIRQIARSLGAENDRFDFYVITGDISTNARSKNVFDLHINI